MCWRGHSVSETFLHREDARAWATEAEGKRTAGRYQRAGVLEMLYRELGALQRTEQNRERLIRFGRDRARAGAGPVTLGQDIGAIKLVISHAAAVHGVEVSVEPVNFARIAMRSLGLIGKGNERDRRPSEEELKALYGDF